MIAGSGIRPSLVSGRPTTVSGAANRTSHRRAISRPADQTAAGDGRNVSETRSAEASATQAATGTASDSTVRIHRLRRGIAVRMASSEGVRLDWGRRTSDGQDSRPVRAWHG